MNSLIQKEFRESLKIGTGKAILILKEYPSINFDDTILEACTHNLALDPQCEGTRADYLFEVLSFAQNREAIETSIVDSLLSSSTDDWDIYLLFDLAAKLARHGNKDARDALYKRYVKSLEDDDDFTETSSTLVEIDGLNGLEFVAEVQGKLAEKDPEFWTDSFLLKVCQDEFPQTSPRTYLKEKSKTNRYIARYLADVEKSEQQSMRRRKSVWTYSEISAQINKGRAISIMAGRKLDTDALKMLAVDFENEQDPKKQVSYLRLFNTVEYPGNLSYIIPFLDSDDKTMSYPAASILGRTNSSIVRKIIDEHYYDLDYLKTHLRIFLRNYQPKDISVFIEIAKTLKDEDEIHDFTFYSIKIFKENMIEYPSQLLSHLYRITNCRNCRYEIVDMLIDADELSDEIYQELEYDCNPEIRKLFHEITE